MNNLYKILSAEGSNVFKIQIDAENEIFKGHFPNLPILPGACMVQIIKELQEKSIQKKITFSEIGQIKFLNMVNPLEKNVLDVEITQVNENKISATIKSEQETILKFSGSYN
jgi:3-hydroxyacyl-[acyl-carrier-protein] dehydratase